MAVDRAQTMNDSDYIREFLAHMGVQAEVRVDDTNQKLIVIETDQYMQRRNWIETWFTLIERTDDYSYFRERPRGTGQTI